MTAEGPMGDDAWDVIADALRSTWPMLSRSTAHEAADGIIAALRDAGLRLAPAGITGTEGA